MKLIKSITPLLTIFGLHDGRETAVILHNGNTAPDLLNPPPWPPLTQPVIEPDINTAPELSPMASMQLAVKLADMIGNPVARLELLERYHRVFLVSFVPHGAVDPVLPVTAVPLGKNHDNCFRSLTRSLCDWLPVEGAAAVGTSMEFWGYQRQWAKEAQLLAKICVSEAAARLEPDEANYYATQMMYSVANPDRRKYGRSMK